MSKINYISGQELGSAVYIREAYITHVRFATFLCKCGKEFTASVSSVKSGHTKSCGCYYKESRGKAMITHGATMVKGSPYKSWEGIKGRCLNPNHRDYQKYGGRGITMCDAWANSYEQFAADMGPRPSLKHSVDRIDNDKGYYKENCRWATQKTQNRNRRINVLITYLGRTQTMADWCEELGVKYKMVQRRIKENGWNHIDALTTPLQQKYSHKNQTLCH